MAHRFKIKGYEFTPLGGPIDDNAQNPIFSEIGMAFTAWARMEHMLLALVIHINKKKTSEHLYDPDPVSKFKELIKLLRKWIKCHEDYKSLEIAGTKIMFSELIEVATNRNILAHGKIETIDPNSQLIRLKSLKRTGKNQWEARDIDLHFDAIKAITTWANLANSYFVECGKVLFDEVEPPQ